MLFIGLRMQAASYIRALYLYYVSNSSVNHENIGCKYCTHKPCYLFFLYLKNESCISIEGSEMIVALLQLA